MGSGPGAGGFASERRGLRAGLATIYREFAPPERLRPYVECFWTVAGGGEHRVLPDGCEDIVFQKGGPLVAVGAMTRARVYMVGAGYEALGARFHPGMARAFLRTPGNELTDRSPDLSAVWGARGERLARRMGAAGNAREAMRLLEEELRPGDGDWGAARRMTLWVVERGGRVRVDDLARCAGLSERHLRRIFLERTGLTPKMFCRVVRFRSAVSSVAARDRSVGWAERALELGYYDQSHMANEFRELSGLAMADFSKTVGHVGM